MGPLPTENQFSCQTPVACQGWRVSNDSRGGGLATDGGRRSMFISVQKKSFPTKQRPGPCDRAQAVWLTRPLSRASLLCLQRACRALLCTVRGHGATVPLTGLGAQEGDGGPNGAAPPGEACAGAPAHERSAPKHMKEWLVSGHADLSGGALSTCVR